MEIYLKDTPPPSSADDRVVGRCDVRGAVDAVASTADKRFVSRNWRKAECEEVADEDAGGYWENKGVEDREVEEVVVQDDNQEDQEESEHRTQVGSTADNSIVQRTWMTVECEDMEDEDAGRYSEDEGEDDQEVVEQEDGEEQGQSEHQMRWTCHTCCTTMNIFARDDHLRSRVHRQNMRIATRHPSPTPLPPSWHCTLCNEHMSIFQQPYHLASKPHLTALRQHTTQHIPTSPATIPPDTIHTLARSSSFEVRNTFYCLTCAAEFNTAEQDLHLATTDTWFCEPCSSRMHPAARERHVDSPMHVSRERASEAPDEVCDVCQCTYPVAQRADHLLGPLHRVVQAGTHTEVHGNAKSAIDNPSVVRADETWYCDICRMEIAWERLASHVVAHCGADIRAAGTGGLPVPQQADIGSTATGRPPVALQANIVPTATGRPAVTQPAVPPVKESKKSKKAKKTEAGTIYCNVCKIDQDTQRIREHLNSQAHKDKAANYHPGTGSARQESSAMC